jgi:phosphoribosylanthranilate isomerase
MPNRTRVKICGVTTPADALLALELGADAIGLNFYPGSPRYVTEESAAAILRELPPFSVTVGVFVQESWERMVGVAKRLGRLHCFQLHGVLPEPPIPSTYPLVAAVPVKNSDSLRELSDWVDRCRAGGCRPAAVLVDAAVPGLHGGTGRTAPWDLLADRNLGVPLLLAGGLKPDNVAEAIRRVRPWGVDVASGVESSPGRKDAEKMRRFLDAVRTAEP